MLTPIKIIQIEVKKIRTQTKTKHTFSNGTLDQIKSKVSNVSSILAIFESEVVVNGSASLENSN